MDLRRTDIGELRTIIVEERYLIADYRIHRRQDYPARLRFVGEIGIDDLLPGLAEPLLERRGSSVALRTR